MDTVLHLYYPYLKTKAYLLDDRGVAKVGKDSKWVQTLTTMGVRDVKVNFLPICKFDCDNIHWNRKAEFASIMLDLWEIIEKYLRYEASGTKIFCSIIQNQQ